MCTVSVIPPDGGRGLRLVTNRDERRTRAAAWPPRVYEIDGISVVSPIDPEGIGTWVAATSHGVVWALMNRSPSGAARRGDSSQSRGRIIPLLASASDADEARKRFHALPLHRFAPFRLIAASLTHLAVFEWHGTQAETTIDTLLYPAVFSSSSLGDELVEQPRRALFACLLERESDPWRAQDRFHAHAWPDRRHLSVLMNRVGAATVSRTGLVMTRERSTMRYTPIVDGWPGPASTMSVQTGRRLLRIAV